MKIRNVIRVVAVLAIFFLPYIGNAQIYPQMIGVGGGTYTMGNEEATGDADERPAHAVTLKSFCIAETETTVMQWMTFCNETGRKMPEQPLWGWNDDDPMVNVSWDDAVAYCKWLSQKTGQEYRLPTEAEFEFAARGGTKSKGFKYSGSDDINQVAWYADNSDGHPQPVATKKPNELGLYDMSGNVWEWCSDWYGVYCLAAATDPIGPTIGSYQVLRGGSWNYSASYSRVTARNAYAPSLAFLTGGFRVASSWCSLDK